VIYADLQASATERHLTIMGGFHPLPDDQTPPDCQTLILLGPNEPAFWPAFTTSPEWLDGAPDPMDRWSRRIIDAWADALDAEALYPFGSLPFLPFFSWALRTGRVHASPIRLLVHDHAGLFVSFRGALAIRQRIDLPIPAANPCTTCLDQPCRTACPVDAFDGMGYDVTACKGYLDTVAGEDCMTGGCAARRACPVSQSYPRLPAHAAYHMTAFKG
jgi:hypothetical protein